MRILINAAYLPPSSSEEYDSLLAATFAIIISRHPEHHFIFVCASQFAQDRLKKDNCTFHLVNAPGTSLLKNKYRLDFSLPRLLKKYKADLFVSPVFCSLGTKLPQCIWMPLLSFINDKRQHSKIQRLFFRKYIPAFLQKASQVVVFSQEAYKSVVDWFPFSKDKLLVSTAIISPVFKPAGDNQTSIIKDNYSDGKEFFLFGGTTNPSFNLLNLLKAFSLFKKRQQSSTKLIIAITHHPADAAFKKSLASYKYRSDVLLQENLDEKEYALLLASAYAFVYPVLTDGLGLRVLQALRSQVPVITSDAPLMKEIVAESALFCNPAEPKSIADQLMRLYKDENLRNELVKKAGSAAITFDSENAAAQLWQRMQKAVLPLS